MADANKADLAGLETWYSQVHPAWLPGPCLHI